MPLAISLRQKVRNLKLVNFTPCLDRTQKRLPPRLGPCRIHQWGRRGKNTTKLGRLLPSRVANPCRVLHPGRQSDQLVPQTSQRWGKLVLGRILRLVFTYARFTFQGANKGKSALLPDPPAPAVFQQLQSLAKQNPVCKSAPLAVN